MTNPLEQLGRELNISLEKNNQDITFMCEGKGYVISFEAVETDQGKRYSIKLHEKGPISNSPLFRHVWMREVESSDLRKFALTTVKENNTIEEVIDILQNYVDSYPDTHSSTFEK